MVENGLFLVYKSELPWFSCRGIKVDLNVGGDRNGLGFSGRWKLPSFFVGDQISLRLSWSELIWIY